MLLLQSKDAVFIALVLERLQQTTPMVASEGTACIIYEPFWRNAERASARFNRYLRVEDQSSVVASVLVRTALLPSIITASWVLTGTLEFQDLRRGRDRLVYEFAHPLASDDKDVAAVTREGHEAQRIADYILEFLVTARVPGDTNMSLTNSNLVQRLQMKTKEMQDQNLEETNAVLRRA